MPQSLLGRVRPGYREIAISTHPHFIYRNFIAQPYHKPAISLINDILIDLLHLFYSKPPKYISNLSIKILIF
jgi:hypothetical protein